MTIKSIKYINISYL